MKTIIHKDAKRLAAGADESPFDVRTKKRNIHRRVMKVTGKGAVGWGTARKRGRNRCVRTYRNGEGAASWWLKIMRMFSTSLVECFTPWDVTWLLPRTASKL
jgi:hypothetical protein